ncbi:MAG: RloB family protein, partial [Bacilli bacterium]
GEGKNTTSLVKTAINIIDTIDKNLMKTTYYEKIFVVFDKDNFTNEEFDNAVNMCEKNNFIPLWSNESFDLWILFHFNLLESS